MIGAPDQAAFLESGLRLDPPSAPAPERIMVIACGAIMGELSAVLRLNDWTHVDLECLPARLHNRPERIPEALRARARAARARGYGRVLAAYGECGAGGRIATVCEEEGVERIDAPNCFAMFDPDAGGSSAPVAELGVFYVTDFLLRHFDALVWRGLGLDRHPELIEMLFSGYDRMVYLAQTDDRALDAAALRAALALGLPYERRSTGLAAFARAFETLGVTQ